VEAIDVLTAITGHVQAQGAGQAANRPPRLATVDALYSSGSPRVTFDGETTLSVKEYPYVKSYTPAAGDRVALVPVGTTYLIIGAISTGTGDGVPTGSVQVYAGAAAPAGWVLCNGAAVSRTTYARLYAVIGTTYGAGNGTTTFNLPNMVDRVPVGSGTAYARAATGGAATVTLSTTTMPSHDHGSSGGHGHSFSGSASSAGYHGHSVSGGTYSAGSHSHYLNTYDRTIFLASGGTGALNYSRGGLDYNQYTTSAGDHSHSISGSADSGGDHAHSVSGSVGCGGDHSHGSTGGAEAHENMPPYLAMPYIIKTWRMNAGGRQERTHGMPPTTEETQGTVTIGEVWRNVQTLQTDMRGVQMSLNDIKTTLAGQGVKVGVVWSALGIGGSAFVLALAGIVLK
jgi:microcystin-dependent protein